MTQKLTGPDLVRDAMRAAENEIERLRLALTTIKEWPISSPLNMGAHNMQVVAHAALSGDRNG